jgi:hypothetical protein
MFERKRVRSLPADPSIAGNPQGKSKVAHPKLFWVLLQRLAKVPRPESPKGVGETLLTLTLILICL